MPETQSTPSSPFTPAQRARAAAISVAHEQLTPRPIFGGGVPPSNPVAQVEAMVRLAEWLIGEDTPVEDVPAVTQAPEVSAYPPYLGVGVEFITVDANGNEARWVIDEFGGPIAVVDDEPEEAPPAVLVPELDDEVESSDDDEHPANHVEEYSKPAYVGVSPAALLVPEVEDARFPDEDQPEPTRG